MARPRKPTAELELNGAFVKDKKRGLARQYEPEPNGPIGDPPNYFDDNQRDLWHEIVGIVPAGVLATSDRLVLEMITRLLEKLREGVIRGAELNILVSCLSRLGLTPADRSRVAVPSAKDDNGDDDDFANFLRKNGAPGRSILTN